MPDIRNLALALLNDDEGINQKAWNLLAQLLWENGDRDIVDNVKAVDGRFYIPEDRVLELSE